MKCANCNDRAKYVFQAPGVADQPYCPRHLPVAYSNTEWVFPVPHEDPLPQDSVAAAEPEAKVAPVEDVELTDEERNPVANKPASRSRRKSPSER